MSHQRQRVHATSCPHCGGRALIRTSKRVTPLVRHIYYRCENGECGHDFVAQLGILYSLRPSSCPDPTLKLPLLTAMTLQAVAAVPSITSEPPEFAAMLQELHDQEAVPKAA